MSVSHQYPYDMIFVPFVDLDDDQKILRILVFKQHEQFYQEPRIKTLLIGEISNTSENGQRLDDAKLLERLTKVQTDLANLEEFSRNKKVIQIESVSNEFYTRIQRLKAYNVTYWW